MKKKTILLMLLLAAPAMANVDVECIVDGSTLTINYDSNEAVPIRAFALDVEATGATIDAIIAYNPHYWVFPGSINIVDPNDANSIVPGDAVAPVNDPDAKGPLGSSAVTVEMGSLYPPGDGNLIPEDDDFLISFALGNMSSTGLVEVTTNETRARIVLEDTTSVDANGVCGWEPSEPPCWSYDCFSCGDSNGDCLITFTDIQAIINAWPPNTYDPCADFSKDSLMTFTDIQIIINHWPPNTACPDCGACTPI